MDFDVARFLGALVSTVLWSLVAILLAVGLFEVLERRYHLIREIFEENSTAAAIFAGSFVLGIFYAIGQIVTH